MPALRQYAEATSATFFYTTERFGAFSNMAKGFPLRLRQGVVPSSEALYQALRFPHRPDLQEDIIAQVTPILAKRRAYANLSETRHDWHDVNLACMRHVLQLKWACHPERIHQLMIQTEGRPIVEISSRSDFWGTFRKGEWLVGVNALGRLLMELRERVLAHAPGEEIHVKPPDIPDPLLRGKPIETMVFPSPQRQEALDL